MFIDWACTLNLIDNEKNTGILKDFPLSVKKILVQQIVSSFLATDSSTSNPAVLPTSQHLSWVMEVVEQGFLLPLEDSQSIFACVDLYKRWLFDARCRPPALADDTDEFYTRKILEHLTLAFQPRTANTREAMDTHIILCQKVLQLYLDIGRALSSKFSTATFELWITLLLAVADSTLNANTRMEDSIARAICPLLLKVLFEVWLHSRTRNAELWQRLHRYAFGWLHHMPVIHQWNLTCLALMSPLVQMVYGSSSSNSGQTTVQVRLEDISLEFDKDYLLYAWNRVLSTIGNPNAIKHPTIFAAAIGGIFQLVSMLLGATDDGNAILHIFGSWLFEAVKSLRPGFEEGVSLSTEILSHIFQTCAPHISFQPIYLSAFYSCLSETLWCDGKVLFSSVLHTQNFLALELPGSRILIPSYIRALGRILTIVPGSTSEGLRRAAIRILGYLVCISNRFESVQFYHFFNKRPMEFYPPLPNDIVGKHELVQPDVNTFRDVRPHVAHLLLSSLNTETNSANLQTLIWYILSFQLEHQHQQVISTQEGVAFLNGAINILLKKSASLTNQWPAEVVVHSFQLLSALAEQYQQLPNFVEFAHTIVRKLCKYIVFKCREHVMSMESEELVSLAIQTMSDWVIVTGWIFEGNYKTDTSTLYMVFDALTIAMGGKDPNEEISSNSSMSSQTSISYLSSSQNSATTSAPSSSSQQDATKDDTVAPVKRKLANLTRVPVKVRETAQTSLQTVLNRMGNYPNPYSINQMDTSSTFVEVDIIEQIRERAKQAGEPDFPVEQCIRFYTIEGLKLMTLIDQPFGNELTGGHPFSTIIIRDSTGRYIINTDLSLVPLRPKLDSGLSSPLSDDQVMSDGESGAPDEFVPTNISGQGGSSFKESNEKNTNSNGNSVGGPNLPFISKYAENQEQFDDIHNYLSRHPDELYTKYVQELVSTETKSLHERQYGLNFTITVNPHVLGNRYSGDCKFQQSRVLLASLGFFGLENKGKVCPMDNTSSFYQALRSLDSVSERVQSRIAVYYSKRGDITEEDVIANQSSNTSNDFKEFSSSLGWTVDVEKHSGYLGGLDRRFSSGRIAQYYATPTKEMAFHIAPIMPNQDGTTNPLEQKKKILSRSQMSVVWCESIEEYEKEIRPKADLLSKYLFQLAIEPKSSGLFKIKTIHGNAPKISFGPVLEEMTVSKHILSPLIKQTLSNANNYLLASEHRLIHPFAQRRRLIADISDSFRSELRVMQNFQNVFLPLEEDKLYRPPPIPLNSSEDVPIFKPVRPTNKQRPISVQMTSPVVPIQPLSLSSTGAVTSGGNPRAMPTPPIQIKPNTSPSMQPVGSSPSKNWGGLKPTSQASGGGGSSPSNPQNPPTNPTPGLRGNFLTRNRSINLSDDQQQQSQQ